MFYFLGYQKDVLLIFYEDSIIIIINKRAPKNASSFWHKLSYDP